MLLYFFPFPKGAILCKKGIANTKAVGANCNMEGLVFDGKEEEDEESSSGVVLVTVGKTL
eukprot:9276564-Ditylum_brightwellii.AAC.1